ncbi:MAG: 16S rRNA (cytosine(1402)-N(4))-methyltransferase RsmH [Enterobacterales bacterium]
MKKKFNNKIHVSVLLKESIYSLNIKPNGIYIDGTFGAGGHSRLILSKLNKHGKLFAIDRDPDAIKIAKDIYDSRLYVLHKPFSKIKFCMDKLCLLGKIDGIILDLGMSGLQIQNPNRGFSFMHNGPLDMRMDYTIGYSAKEWLLNANFDTICLVLKKFGEERFYKQISHALLKNKHSLDTTIKLANLIKNTLPFYYRNKHPATRTFQAIRIYINNELEEIKKILIDSLNILNIGGRLSIISFNSLEDRIVKNFIKKFSKPEIPLGLPITEQQILKQYQHIFKLISFNKIYPSIKEIKNNPSARSAILRYAEKI